jgi:alpha-ketoglutarate-dependent taurine dioxygenase
VWNLPCAISLLVWYVATQRQQAEAEPEEEEEQPAALPNPSWTSYSNVPLSGRTAFGANLPLPDLLVHVRRCVDIGDESLPAHAQFIEVFNKYGVCVLQCSEFPPDALELKEIFGETVPHELADEEGRVTIDPSADRASSNVKATDAEHRLHTDEAYSDRPGRILTLACEIASPSGGENVVVSVKAMYQAAAAVLDPAGIHALFSNDALTIGRTLPGSTNYAESKIAIFNQLMDGRAGARWRSRDSYLKDILEGARPGFEFLEKFVEEEVNRLIVKLAPGQVLIMDNTAVLHGRLPFPQGERRRMVRINYFNNGTLRAKVVQGFSLRARSLVPSSVAPSSLQARSLASSRREAGSLQARSLAKSDMTRSLAMDMATEIP